MTVIRLMLEIAALTDKPAFRGHNRTADAAGASVAGLQPRLSLFPAVRARAIHDPEDGVHPEKEKRHIA